MSKERSRVFKYFILAILLSHLMSLSAFADSPPSTSGTLSEEMILFQDIPSVYGASKYEQKITEAPSSVSIVTAAEVKKYGYRTLADILRSIRGFYITNDRNYSYIGVRGFNRPGDYNSRILLLVDGHRINENIYDSILVGTEFILDVDLIDRIEIIRGPGSSLYGANAFFAVINVITRQGRDLRGPEVSAAAGSFDTYQGRLSYGNKFRNGLEAILSGSSYDSRGQRLFFREFDDPSTNNGIADNSDYDRFNSLFTKVSFGDFTLHGAYAARKKGVPTSSFGTIFNDPGTFTFDERAYIELKHERSLGARSEIASQLYYDQYYYHGDYVFDYPPVTVNKDFARGKWWGAEVKFTTVPMVRHKLILGAEYRRNFQQDQGNYDLQVYLDDRRDSKIWAVYFQDEFTILENLILNAGVRYDDYYSFGSSTNPRVALIYNPFERTFFKLIYGKAFRPPNVYELYYNDGGLSTKSNSDLRPETIHTYELICEQYVGDRLRFEAAGFYYRIKNLISQQTDPADNLIVFRNLDEVEAVGIELEMEGKWDSGVEGRISYTYQEAENRFKGALLTNSPRHLAKLNLIVPLMYERLFAGMEVQYTGKRKTLAGNFVDGFFVTNVTLFSQYLISGLEMSGSIYNLFDKKYGDPGAEEHVQDSIEQDGRSFRFKVTYGF